MKKKLPFLLLVFATALSLLFTSVLAAPVSTWSGFRGSDDNMAILDAPTPDSAELACLKWASSVPGASWDAAVSIWMVGGRLFTAAGNRLSVFDAETGEQIDGAELSHSRGQSCMSPVYENGTLFIPLDGGRIEAINAKTLESLWVFEDTLSGQALSPIIWKNGRLYTGFWTSETDPANFVCVDAASGELIWSYSVPGGFYWAGPVAVGDFIVVGTDDGAPGASGNSHLLVFDQNSEAGEPAEVLSDVLLEGCGDQRSAMAYADGRVYFTTKGGYLCSAEIDPKTGEVRDLLTVSLGAQSTSTPVVYDDYVYLGTGGGISTSGSSGHFVVANRETLVPVAYAGLKGMPQCSFLLSTANDDALLFYSTYNNLPGGLSLIQVDPDNVSHPIVSELYDAAGYEQYCIGSVICDNEGTLYYANDSGRVFAVGSNLAYALDLAVDGVTLADFQPGTLSYEAVVPTDHETAVISARGDRDSVVSINGEPGENGAAQAEISVENGAKVVITVEKSGFSRTYTVRLRRPSDETGLASLKVNETNAYHSFLALDAELSPERASYVCAGVSADRSFVNVWPEAEDSNASVSVFAVSGVKDTAAGEEILPVGQSEGHDRYAVYFADTGAEAIATMRIVVTAEDGKATRSFELLLTKRETFDRVSGDVIVTIADKGRVVMALQKVAVLDLDFDGKLNVDETLYAAHEAAYPGGAAAGYASVLGDYGLSIVKLWGDTTSLSYGYWLDDDSCWSLADEVRDGQKLVAFVYANTSWPNMDVYTAFDCDNLSTKPGSEETLTLYRYDYNTETFAYAASPCAGAQLTAYRNGHALTDGFSYADNEDGSYRIDLHRAGVYDVIATTPGNTIVPAVCRVTVEGGSGGGSGSSDSPTSPAEPSTPADGKTDLPFTDLAGHWAESAVQFVFDAKLMQGVSETLFAPDETLSRAMTVTLLHRLAGSPDVEDTASFSDIPSDTWYTKPVIWAAQNKVSVGRDDGTFGPMEPVTREQLAALLFRYAQLKNLDLSARTDLSAFSDGGAISNWAQDAMGWACAKGVLTGRPSGALDPQGTATRAEAATILMRFLSIT